MGLLDPKLDKERTFELLRKKGADRAELTFSGGHDEGDVQSIKLFSNDAFLEELVVWYCGGYGFDPKRDPNDPSPAWVPMSTPANEDEELSDLLQGPVNETFGAWGGQPYTSGRLVWDVAQGTAAMEYQQDEPHEYTETW